MKELKDQVEELQSRLRAIAKKINRPDLNQKLLELEALTMKGDFWADVNSAQKIMQEVSDTRGQIQQIDSLEARLQNLLELSTLTVEEVQDLDINKEFTEIEKQMNEAENKLFLSGKFDKAGAFLSIHAGQGGVEAMDWVAMLERMYQRFCEQKNWSVKLIDETKGEEAGIKSVTIEISGSFVYGLLKKESGTHRLVRQSPFNADALRQTSFALVEVLPVVEETSQLVINENDLEYDMFRSSGPGGQNVQKVSTAVRIKHIPTGITVTCQSERSQHQNKENALKILTGKLAQLEEIKQREAQNELKDWQKTASWGTQIRSYVLHPYQLVKDLRTGYETSQTEAVLNGELNGFIEAEIRL